MNLSFKNLFLAAAHIFGILFFGLFLYSAHQNFQITQSAQSLGLVLVNAVFLALYFLRREPRLVSTAPFAWAMSFTGTLLPVFLRPTDDVEFSQLADLGLAIQLLGMVLILLSLAFLRQSFGIVPAHRGIRRDGLYRFIRHPLYASELLCLYGYVVAYPSAANILLLGLQFGIQYSRARMEEHFLLGDPIYREYVERTRYRFIPGVI